MPAELSGEIAASEFSAPAGDDLSDIRRLYRKYRAEAANDPALDRRLVERVLRRAREIVRHPSRPQLIESALFEEYPQCDLDLEVSLENDPKLQDSRQLRVERLVERPFSCVLMLDCSSSMAGDKHLLASIAVAVVLLKMPERSALITFAGQAKTIKAIEQREPIERTVLNFLNVRPRGFTNVAAGLVLGLSQSRRCKRKVALLVSDGRTTEGEDPLDIAGQFDALGVLHLQGSGSDLRSSQMIAQRGRGLCIEVERFEDLPKKTYEALRLLGRL